MSEREELHRVVCHLDKLLAARDMTLVELSDLVGITVANLSILKNDRARAIRFSTLTSICDASTFNQPTYSAWTLRERNP